MGISMRYNALQVCRILSFPMVFKCSQRTSEGKTEELTSLGLEMSLEELPRPAGIGKICPCDHLKYADSTGSTWFHMTPRFSNILHVMRLWMTLNLQ